MLSENQIDKLIQPLIERQRQIEQEILEIIGQRIADTKGLLPSDVYRLQQLYRTGADVRKINKKLADLTKYSENQIKKIIKEVAQGAYTDAKPFYDYRDIPFIPLAQNAPLQTAIAALERVTLADYDNLSNSTAFVMRDPTNPLIIRPTTAAQTYREVIDRAIQSAVTGTDSYNTLIPKAIQDLTHKGLTVVDYTTDEGKPHRMRLDSVVRRNILDGIRNVQQTVQDITGEQFGADGVELSVHQYSAPDHEPIQGHQFTNEEYDKLQTGQPFKDVNGVKFGAIERPIGAWNCRHFAWSIVIGEATPNYTPEELEEIKRNNADGITVKDADGNDVKKPMYWCTQKQREYELRIRQAKEGAAMAEKANEPELAKKYKATASRLRNEYTLFSDRCGLRPRCDKTRIYI